MSKTVRTLAIVLLFFLGITALSGSIGMIIDPGGGKMKLPADLLDNTPFDTLLAPAVILGLANGLLSIIIAIMTIRRAKFHGWLVILQGCILAVWLTAEVIMGMYFAILHLPYYAIALVLIFSGVILVKKS